MSGSRALPAETKRSRISLHTLICSNHNFNQKGFPVLADVVTILTEAAESEVLYPNYHGCKMLKTICGYVEKIQNQEFERFYTDNSNIKPARTCGDAAGWLWLCVCALSAATAGRSLPLFPTLQQTCRASRVRWALLQTRASTSSSSGTTWLPDRWRRASHENDCML